MFTILAKKAVMFIRHPRRDLAETKINNADPNSIIRVKRDEIKEVPDWVREDRQFQRMRTTGNILVLESAASVSVPGNIETEIPEPVKGKKGK